MEPIILQSNPRSPVSEAYRTLRTNIQFASFDKDIHTILITSSGPSEGKTTTSVNFAYSIAETGKRVLLVDCDLRKPSIHKRFKLSNQTGLSNLLIDNLKLEDVTYKFMDNFNILTSGTIPPNPAEMLSSKKIKAFIDEVREKFDYVILDSPPVIAVTDAQVLSTMVDGVLLVVSSGEADRDALKRTRDLLLNVNANILGAVLNKIDIKSRNNYGYYYYYGENKERRKRK